MLDSERKEKILHAFTLNWKFNLILIIEHSTLSAFHTIKKNPAIKLDFSKIGFYKQII